MPEGSPPDPQSPPPAEDASAPAPKQEFDVAEAERTVAEVEAIWKNRVSGKDKAHAAEVEALRKHNETLQSRLSAVEKEALSKETVSGSEAELWKGKATELEAQLAQERQARITETRAAKYPYAAEMLGVEGMASMDEGKLAGLNARLSDEGGDVPPPPVIDPNSAPRSAATPPTPLREKSVADLKGDLERLSPEFEAGLRG